MADQIEIKCSYFARLVSTNQAKSILVHLKHEKLRYHLLTIKQGKLSANLVKLLMTVAAESFQLQHRIGTQQFILLLTGVCQSLDVDGCLG